MQSIIAKGNHITQTMQQHRNIQLIGKVIIDPTYSILSETITMFERQFQRY